MVCVFAALHRIDELMQRRWFGLSIPSPFRCYPVSCRSFGPREFVILCACLLSRCSHVHARVKGLLSATDGGATKHRLNNPGQCLIWFVPCLQCGATNVAKARTRGSLDLRGSVSWRHRLSPPNQMLAGSAHAQKSGHISDRLKLRASVLIGKVNHHTIFSIWLLLLYSEVLARRKHKYFHET